jgi:predicted dehydrogenase
MMGARHLRGMGELERAALDSIRLLGVCDVREEAAEKVAEEAEALLGERPEVFTSVDDALAKLPDLQAVDVVTDPRSHDDLVVSLREAGLHVICEKHLALTVARGQRMVEAAERTGRILATAENNRRDPMSRLAKACIEGGLIGEPNFALQLAVNPGGNIIATAWRHRLAMGGVLLDVAIHLGYILEYLLGPIESIYAQAQIVQAERSGKEFDGKEVEVAVDAEDAFAAVIEFASGAQGQWTSHFASSGEGIFKRLIIGNEGTLNCPGDRSGNAVEVRRGAEALTGPDLLEALPDYHLNDIETRLFGERPASYSLEGPITDRKLLAAELYDFVDAIRNDRPPEVDGARGLRAVAIIYSILESSLSGGPVQIEDVLSGRVRAYQDKVEAASD